MNRLCKLTQALRALLSITDLQYSATPDDAILKAYECAQRAHIGNHDIGTRQCHPPAKRKEETRNTGGGKSVIYFKYRRPVMNCLGDAWAVFLWIAAEL